MAATLSSCNTNDVASSSSHIHTDSEYNHIQEGNKTQNTSSKKSPNKNDKDDGNDSSNKNIGINRPVVSGRDENVDYDNYIELPSQGKSVSERLFDDLEQYDNKHMYFFNVKNTTYASTSYVSYEILKDNLRHYKEISDEQEIRDFKQSLFLYAWTAKKFTASTTPRTVIYFDDDYHLNVEGKIDDAYWLSLNAKYGKVYYIVPEAVYKYVVEYCEQK